MLKILPAHRMPTNSKFDAWGFTKLYLTLRLETTFIRKKRLNIIKQSYILFFPQMSPNVFFSHVKTFPGTFLCVGVSIKMTI